MDNFKRLPAHVHSTAYILYATTTRAFDCPLNSSNYKRRTQLAIFSIFRLPRVTAEARGNENKAIVGTLNACYINL